MRKSNWIIVGILVLASIIFLIMWFTMGFNLVDSPVDLALTVCWWILIIATCILIHVLENRRQRTLRTMFIAPGLIYNSELGVTRLKDGEHYVPTMKKMLTDLHYGFDKKDIKNNTKIRFKYIIHTYKFSSKGNTWEGDVVKVASPNDVKKFSNEAALAKLLEEM